MNHLHKVYILAVFLLLLPSLNLRASNTNCINSNTISINQSACDTANKYVGETETRYNWSIAINKFIRYGGGGFQSSWCMYFVVYCYGKAFEAIGISSPLKKVGLCCKQYQYAMHNNRINVIKPNLFIKLKLLKGDIIIWKRSPRKRDDDKNTWPGHTGIVESQLNEKEVMTIEGNTNIQGTAEGGTSSKDGVWRKKRSLFSNRVVAILRIIK